MKQVRHDWEKQLRQFPLNPKGVPKKLIASVEERIAMNATTRSGRGFGRAAAIVALFAALLLALESRSIIDWFNRTVQTDTFDTKSERSIKVQWVDGPSFMSRYGKAFIINRPNMDVEAIGFRTDPQKDAKQAYDEMIARDKPDVVYISLDLYRQLASEGRLTSLTPFMLKDKFKLTDFHENIVNLLRDSGGGQMYGLTPDFMTEALYYNKDIFDRYGVSYPTDRMSWDDLFRLAQRFPATGREESRVYGLASPASAQAAATAAAKTLGLAMIDAEGKRVTVNTESFRPIWSMVADGVGKGWLYEAKPSSGSISGIDYYKRNPFLTGNAAMALYHSGLALDLINAKKKYDLANFRWDIVTEPVNPADPNRPSSFLLTGIYAIPAESANSRDAWELIKMVNSEAMVAKTLSSSVSSRKKMSSTPEYRTEAFTMLTSSMTVSHPLAGADYSFNSEFGAIVNDEIKSAASGAKSLDAAITSMQSRGQTALDRVNSAK